MFYQRRILLTLAAWAIALGALGYLFSNILSYLLIALVLSTILKPLVNWLVSLRFYKVRIPRSLAVLMGFLLVIFAVGLFIFTLSPLIIDQVNLLRKVNFDEILYSFDGSIRSIERFLIKNHFVEDKMGFLKKSVRVSAILNSSGFKFSEVLNELISITSSFLVSLLAVFFISFFLLYEDGILKRMMLSIVPNAYFELLVSALYKIEKMLTSYLIGLLLELSYIFTLTAVGLSIIGVKYAITVAVFSALVAVVPYFGSLASMILAVLVGLSTAPAGTTQDQYVVILVSIIILTTAIRIIDDVLIQPLIYSRRTHVHPLAIFVAIFAGASLGGIIGMVLAIPTLTTAKVIYEELDKGYDQFKIFTLPRQKST